MKKLETNLEYPLEIKSLDGEAGHFEGYLSVYGDLDKQQDIVDKGAWTVALNPMPIFYRHNRDEPLGAITGFKEDDYGLLIEGDLDLAVERSREIHALMKRGILKLSPGYVTLEDYFDGQIRHIKSGEIYEASITPFPANLNANFTSVKEEDYEDSDYDEDTNSKSTKTEPGLSQKEEELAAVLKAEEGLILKTKELKEAIVTLLSEKPPK
jgi:HK97 family phage prohead protease